MIVGWTNYAGVSYCVPCADKVLLTTEVEESEPIWENTYGAMQPCNECKRLINQCNRVRRCKQCGGYDIK